MNKKTLTETDIRTKFITPAIVGESGSKWDVMTQILEQLMALVNELETQLAASRVTAANLLPAVVGGFCSSH